MRIFSEAGACDSLVIHTLRVCDLSQLTEFLEAACSKSGTLCVVRHRAETRCALAAALASALHKLPMIEWKDGCTASFAEFLAARVPHGMLIDEVADALPISDLVIAWACVHEVPGGPAALVATHGALIRNTAAKIGGASADDIVQRVYQNVLVRPSEGAAIGLASYTGQGPLAVFMHVVTLRLALNAVRDESRRKEEEEDELDSLPAYLLTHDSELELVRAACLPTFKSALQRALSELSPRDRNLLRYTLLDRMSLDDLGKIHGVHRATIARWLASAREQLGERIHADLRDTLRIDPNELASLLRQIRSRLDLSLPRILAEPSP